MRLVVESYPSIESYRYPREAYRGFSVDNSILQIAGCYNIGVEFHYVRPL